MVSGNDAANMLADMLGGSARGGRGDEPQSAQHRGPRHQGVVAVGLTDRAGNRSRRRTTRGDVPRRADPSPIAQIMRQLPLAPVPGQVR